MVYVLHHLHTNACCITGSCCREFVQNNSMVVFEGTSEGVADVLFGREDEVAAIESQVEKCIKSSCSVSMYISGPPGTGKTASVELVMRRLSAKYRFVYQSFH